MKNTFLKYLAAFAMLSTAACQKVDLRKDAAPGQGLLNVMISIPGEATEYPARVAGPYQDGDTIAVPVPTSEENPLDVTKLKIFASLGHNSTVSPALGPVFDLSEPLAITVTTGEGERRTHYIKAVPTLPKTVFSKLWFKTAADLGVKRTNISGATVVGDHLIVADFNAGNTGIDNGLRVYDYATGTLIKSIAPPTTFCMQVVADDAGHFAVNRYNIYSAGFMVYYYEDIDSQPELILNYAAAAGAPVNLGRKMSIIGNLKSGKAYIYATTNGNNNIYYWELNDGEPVSQTPTVIRYASAEPWTYAHVVRQSLDPQSDHYLTYCNYVTTDTDLNEGSRFSVFTPDMDVSVMDKSNHYYKVHGFDVFEINGDRFLAVVTQGFWAWDATHLKVYEITDPSKISLVAGAEGYRDFMLFESEAYGGTNYNRYGDIAVHVHNNVATIFATLATNDSSTGGVMAYRMVYNPQ